MKNHRLSLSICMISFCLADHAFAAAFQLYELGTPIIGTAAVGQAAVANDASTAYFNPAGMTELSYTSYMLGTQIIFPYTNFRQQARTTIKGDNGNNAATPMPGLDLYYVYSVSPQFKLGVSVVSPYGGLLNYNDGWVGRYAVQDITFYTFDLNPALAYRFSDCFALGVGFTIEYTNLQETVALPIKESLTIDGQANIKVDNTSAGFNLGLFYTPSAKTNIGLAYRSRITHHLTGQTVFYRIEATPPTSTKLVMPQTVILSFKQGVTDCFSLLGEVGWSNWSTMKNTVLQIREFTVSIPRKWHDTYRIGLGGNYNVTPDLLLQAGASYDSSPTKPSFRLPDLPMDRQVRLGTGVVYSPIAPVHLGFSYEYINFGKAGIVNTTRVGTLSGNYPRNFASVVQASINVDC